MASEHEREQQRQQVVARLCEELGLDAPPVRLQEALTHPSYKNEQAGALRDNQRLEFLGDAVLGLSVSELLMEAFREVDEGQLTVMRASLVNTQTLAARARELSLADALLVGRGADASGERLRTNVLADAMEAIIGAVYVDGGLEAARELARRLLAERLAKLIADGGVERDAKSRLQELLQARGLPTPDYRVASVEGPPHARVFRVEVDVPLGADEPLVGRGEGRSKKIAEQKAALDALARIDDEGWRSDSSDG
jgi:ribonuclease-3